MQSKYDFSPLSAPPDNYLGLQLFYATRRSRPETTYLFKRYDCPTLAHVDSLVKTALAIVRTGTEGGLQLLEVVPIEEEGGKYRRTSYTGMMDITHRDGSLKDTA
jgi:hypothetical protein